ncbi:Piwi domain-containing protein [Thermoflavimicrobium dichotomicum]|uniref:Protein argonaute n=1 Tax=Thermoflavimicrobium dichotomicum TaxID=46223 RepID=A0A1I3LMA1_9BACL|nr:Piwi domain-containing protein [Thermoflavimicrobium dichotomicum]SFI85833.1 Piwi domain-containing protein [Thermoflavimicrobium dichotomicum]
MEKAHFISEWTLETKASDLPIYLYTIPQTSQEISQIEKYTAKIKYEVMRQNPGILLESAGHLLGSFQKVKAWGNFTPIREEFRCIQVESSVERRLLERLLARSFENAQDPNIFYTKKNTITIKKAKRLNNDIEMRRYLQFEMNVYPSGLISIGFDLHHQFSYRKSLYDMILKGVKLEENCQVVDIINRKTYHFHSISDQTVSDPLLSTGESPIDYYRNNGNEKYVKNIPPYTPAIICFSPTSSKPLYFIPQLLRLVCTWDQVPIDGKKETKIPVDDRVQRLIKGMGKVMNDWKNNCPDLPIRFHERSLFADQAGFRIKVMKKPTLLFGQGVEDTWGQRGLKKGGVISPPKKPIECQILIDDNVVKNFTKRYKHGLDFPFTIALQKLSNKLGVTLERSALDSGKIRRIHFDDALSLREELQEAAKIMNREHPLIIVAKKEHLEKKVGSRDFYSLIKHLLGRDHCLRTQVVTYETSELKSKGSENILLNILLGLYVKNGVHPWKLKHPLHSDCFVGLDVSHEGGIHTTGIIQVVGKDGTPLWTKPLSNSERGEVIRRETIEQSINHTLDRYKQKEGRYPSHITFHRDGKGHLTEVNTIRDILNQYHISFDYVAIEKNILRRMAYKDNPSPNG